MTYQLEVCIDNIESLLYAVEGGATRIELCSSLALGGLTPSAGFMMQAAKHSQVPVYAMVRPRQGDFLYSAPEVEIMAQDITIAANMGMDGVVLGLLTQDGRLDIDNLTTLISQAQQLGLGVTFHRAFDQCSNTVEALEQLINLGCERVLTSGLANSAFAGIECLEKLHQQAKGRISIMAGAGISPDNVAHIIAKTGITELHLSGKTTRQSAMSFRAPQAKMGAEDTDDYVVPVTDQNTINHTAMKIRAAINKP
ncbi:copper homeostasis protein CutC [Vibrio methylphosphonaticus]|uniref:copper homeostasis protein CutC n=1 Tax=Vibrio methylphosphonaticus TaxID=2946866 RepID=UPI00202A4579|nr:copper homeostasis protein CutC [Vibrio methylphosphonaticus]MCL9775950.1 copper homeostasis protein CutC [Vibrio methylphosphonaticus]